MSNNFRKIGMVAKFSFAITMALLCFAIAGLAQELPEPQPGPQRPIVVPPVREEVLPNGLRLVVVQRTSSPLVTVKLNFRSGAENESLEKAGLADMTVSMLAKGTKTRTAPQIASGIESLGGSLDSGAGWTSGDVTLGIPTFNLAKAFDIFADVISNPTFDQKELDLLKSQALDGLSSNLRQPSYLGNFAASVYSFEEHPATGTPDSLNALTRDDLVKFREEYLVPNRATIVFVGDVSFEAAKGITQRYFGKWKRGKDENPPDPPYPSGKKPDAIVRRILVVDLPNTGQASVSYVKRVRSGRTEFQSSDAPGKADPFYFRAQVLNAVLGGGYSSRLNQEIRIKRGLSYGASSSFAWRLNEGNFSARAQTKNESAAEVAELTVAEVARLIKDDVSDPELKARKSVLVGSFGQALETNSGIASQLAALYSLRLSAREMNSYVGSIDAVGAAPVKDYASRFLMGGDLVVVGDNAVFGADLAKRFPGVPVTVVKASELDLSKLK